MDASDAPRLGLAESIERLDAMPEFLLAAVDSAGADGLRFKPSPEEFSLLEHACHLRDLEREGYLVRVRRTLSESAPQLEGFDGAAVAAARDYFAQDAHQAARDFAAARAQATGLLAELTPAQLAREASFMGRRVCLADVVAMMVEHDRGHREEIARLVDLLP
jgi:hypothetical protein